MVTLEEIRDQKLMVIFDGTTRVDEVFRYHFPMGIEIDEYL